MYTAIYDKNTPVATIYSRPDCPWCVNAKKLCKEKRQSYTEVIIGEDIEVDDFKTKFPDVKSVPYIIIDEIVIGNFLDLEKYLNTDNN
jgi:glutaredoxin 3